MPFNATDNPAVLLTDENESLVKLPAMGFANLKVGTSNPSAPTKAGPALAEENVLQNEFFKRLKNSFCSTFSSARAGPALVGAEGLLVPTFKFAKPIAGSFTRDSFSSVKRTAGLSVALKGTFTIRGNESIKPHVIRPSTAPFSSLIMFLL